jgi:hypothetical protein
VWPTFRHAAGIDGIAAIVDIANAILAGESTCRPGASLPARV